jgi:hypothetical protein
VNNSICRKCLGVLKKAAVTCAMCGAFVVPALHTDASAALPSHPMTPASSAVGQYSGESPHDPLPTPTGPPPSLAYSGTASTFPVSDPLYASFTGGAARTI